MTHWRVLHTLRFRLAALNLLVFGAVFIASSLMILHALERYLRADFDDNLKSVAQSALQLIINRSALPSSLPVESSVAPRLNPFHFPGFFLQIRAADGRVLERSETLGENTLPIADACVRQRPSSPVLETVGGIAVQNLLHSQETLRMLSVYYDGPRLQPFFLQVGISSARLDSSIRRRQQLFLAGVPSSLLAVGLASWFVARRSLAPIGRIARTAQELDVTRFDQRIPALPSRDEVSEMVTTINGMLDRLEAGFRAHERFIADAAHELKTPVATLLAEVQVLRQLPRTAEEYTAFGSSIESELRRVTQIIDSLLILARANAGYPIALATPVSLNDAVTEAVERCNDLASQRQVRVVPTLWLPRWNEPEPIVRGDEDLLGSMLGNLIRNAIWNSPPRGTVQVELVADNHSGTIRIRDEGPGIPPGFVEKVFESFFRVPGDHPHGGAGLGLAIAKGVVSLHAGSISVSNRPSGGCEFVVVLPMAKDD